MMLYFCSYWEYSRPEWGSKICGISMEYQKSEWLLNINSEETEINSYYDVLILLTSVAAISLVSLALFAVSGGGTPFAIGSHAQIQAFMPPNMSNVSDGVSALIKPKPTLTLSKGGKFTNFAIISFSISDTDGLMASLYVDNSIVATTTSSNTYTLSGAGLYTVMLKSPADKNYAKKTVGPRTFNIIASLNVIPTLKYSNGNSIIVGSTDIITANCTKQSSSDTCAIYYGATQISNGIGAATYNAGLLPVGTYAIYASDLTNLLTSEANTLTVSNVANAIPTLTYSNGNRTVIGATDIITANCAAQSASDTCTIWYSGNQIASGTGSVTYNAGVLAVGTYPMYANDITDLQSSALSTLSVANQRACAPTNSCLVNAPPNINYYVPITLSNNQSSNTPVPFQEHVQLNVSAYTPFEANDLSNIEFFYSNGTIVPSWLEDNNANTGGIADYWLKINGGISAFGNVTVYMGFANTNLSLLDGVNVGEAPQFGEIYGYSTGHPYAQYDNGANIFTNYWNFAGRALPSSFTNVNSITYSVNNGLTIEVFSTKGGYSALQTLQNYGANNAIDFSGWFCGHIGATGNYNTGVGFGNSINSNSVLVGQELQGQFNLYASGATGASSGTLPYLNCTQTTYSVGYTDNFSFAQENYGSAPTVNEVPTVAGPIQIQQQDNLKMYLQWLRVRAVPANNIMPSTAFGCITSASTSSCTIPTISMQSNPAFYNQNNNVVAYAPQAMPNDQVNLVVDGNTVANGAGSAAFNIATLPIGTHAISAVEANTGVTTSMTFYMARSYNYANITLPNYAKFTPYLQSTLNIQLPVVSWNAMYPGIYYVDSSNNLDEYQFGNGITTTVAAVTPLWHNWPSYQMISTLFWVVGPNKDRALFFGTKTSTPCCMSANDLWLETVNLTNGNVLMVNTMIKATSTDQNAQADYIGNDIAQIVCSNGVIEMFNMATGAIWKGGTLGFFEANNEYYVPKLDSIINVQAAGSTADGVEQWQLNGNVIQPVYTKVAAFYFDRNVEVNGVDGVVYDPTTSEIFFTGGWYDMAPTAPSSSGQFTGGYLIHVNSSGIITLQNETKYSQWPFMYDMNNMIHIGYTTTDGYLLGMRFSPDANGWHPYAKTASGRLSQSAYTDSINPFLGGRSWIPIPPNERWLFNVTLTASDGFSEFQYSNTNYGIAPLSAISLQTTNQITWFWNSSIAQFPN